MSARARIARVGAGPGLRATTGRVRVASAVDRYAVLAARTRAPRASVRTLARVVVPVADAVALGAVAFVAPSWGWTVAFVVAALTVGNAQSSYRARIAPSVFDDVPAILSQAALPLLVLGPIAAARDAAGVLWLPVVALPALVAARTVSFQVVRTLRRRGLLVERTLVVGAGHQGTVIADTLRHHPEYGLAPVAFLDTFQDELDPPIIGTVGELDDILRQLEVERVVVAFGSTREPEMVTVLRACDNHRVSVHIVPRFFELGVAPRSPDTEHIWGIPLVRLRRAALRPAARRAKRIFDVVVATAALVLLAPLMAVTALVVRASGPGPVLFRQKRVGEGGKVVEVLKFRTMPVNDDSETTWNVEDDERVTRIGGFLRKTSIDELPQLINVLRGEMSIVGPRPERPFFVEQFDASIPRYTDRHRLPGGMTGWAQVNHLRGDTSIEERARFDNHYIEHWSLWRDLVIVVKTFATFFRRSP